MYSCVLRHDIRADPMPRATTAELVPLHLELVLLPEICAYSLKLRRGLDWHKYKLGPALCEYLQGAAEGGFRQVTVTSGETPTAPQGGANASATPTVVAASKKSSPLALPSRVAVELSLARMCLASATTSSPRSRSAGTCNSMTLMR